MRVPLEKPRPDIESFKRTILEPGKPGRLHLVELKLDTEIVRTIQEVYMGMTWIEPSAEDRKQHAAAVKNYVECCYRLGYDYVRLSSDMRRGAGLGFSGSMRTGDDTAGLSRGQRKWTEQGTGIISSWKDLEEYSWPRVEDIDLSVYEDLGEHLPDGMGLFVCGGQGILETSMNTLLGYENLCYLSIDEPDLVAEVFRRVGELMLAAHSGMVGLRGLAGFFQGDDLGFKTGTLLSPEFLKEHVLPWHKKIAALAHENGLLYLFHSCGDLDAIMDDLIDDVKIDARHSFEDAIEPVTVFAKRYGRRVGVLGGVDVHKLCTLGETELRGYVKGILDECVPRGRYAFGTGNSVANYVPVESYLIMLDEALCWEEQNL